MKNKTDWAAIRSDYITGRGGYRTLAKVYGVSESSLTKRGAKERWKIARDAAREAGDAKGLEGLIERLVGRALGELDRYPATRTRRVKKLCFEEGATKPTEEILEETVDQAWTDGPVNVKALRELTNIWKELHGAQEPAQQAQAAAGVVELAAVLPEKADG